MNCEECEDADCVLRCLECEGDFCEECFQALHKRGKRATHTTVPVAPAMLSVSDSEEEHPEETDAQAERAVEEFAATFNLSHRLSVSGPATDSASPRSVELDELGSSFSCDESSDEAMEESAGILARGFLGLYDSGLEEWTRHFFELRAGELSWRSVEFKSSMEPFEGLKDFFDGELEGEPRLFARSDELMEVYSWKAVGRAPVEQLQLVTEEAEGAAFPCRLCIASPLLSMQLGSHDPFTVLRWMGALREADLNPMLRIERSDSMMCIQNLIMSWTRNRAVTTSDSSLDLVAPRRPLERSNSIAPNAKGLFDLDDVDATTLAGAPDVVPPPRGRTDSLALSNAKGLFDLDGVAPAPTRNTVQGQTFRETVLDVNLRLPFVAFEEAHFCSEVLSFWLRAQKFASLGNEEERLEALKRIYDLHLKDDSLQQVNVPRAMLKRVERALKTRSGVSPSLLTDISDEVQKMLHKHWQEFMLLDMRQKMGETGAFRIDICNALANALHSPETLQKLLVYASATHREGNLLFWLLCRQYRTVEADLRRELALDLFERFINSSSAPSGFSLSEGQRGMLVTQFAALDVHALLPNTFFDEAMLETYETMQRGLYAKFCGRSNEKLTPKRSLKVSIAKKLRARTRPNAPPADEHQRMLMQLRDPHALRGLLLFAISQHEADHVLFWTMVQEYKEAREDKDRRRIGERILMDFVAERGPRAISVQHREEIHFQWSASPSNPARHIFDQLCEEVEQHMLVMLFPAWERFRKQEKRRAKPNALRGKKGRRKPNENEDIVSQWLHKK